MKIIVFGVGRYFANRRKKLAAQMWQGDEIVALLDNNADTIKSVDGMRVDRVERITEMEYDIVLLMSAKSPEMKRQLLELGVDEDKIYCWDQYLSLMSHGKLRMYIGSPLAKSKKSVLIVSNDLNYNGGAIAAIYAAKALRGKGYDACLCTSRVEEEFAEKLVGIGLNVVVCPALPYVGKEEQYLFRKFDITMANVYHTLPIACEMAKVRPTLWWIHEPDVKYDPALEEIRVQFSKYDCIQAMQGINIYAVSEIAKRNFENFHPHRVDGILPYGIPDESGGHAAKGNPQDKPFVFAIIGSVSPRKAQRIFLEAAAGVEVHGREAAFWVIGSCGNDPYGQEVQEQVRSVPQARLLGRMTREEIREAFRDIDCVVCASLEDPLPIVVTEGMMHGKVCITTDATGQAEILQDGVNGFLCKAGDRDALREKMQWVLDRRAELGPLRRKARETYETHFSMEAFADRLENALLEAERAYRERDPEKAEG